MPIKDVSGQSLQQLVSLDGKVAVVTGAGRGIGLAIARRLTEAGANVLLGDVDVPAAEASAAQLSAEFGRRVIGVPLNVAEEASIVALAMPGGPAQVLGRCWSRGRFLSWLAGLAAG